MKSGYVLLAAICIALLSGCGGGANRADTGPSGLVTVAAVVSSASRAGEQCVDRWNRNDFGGLVSEASSSRFDVEAIDSTTCSYSFPMTDGAGASEYAAVTSSSDDDTVVALQQSIAISAGPAPGFRSNATLSSGHLFLNGDAGGSPVSAEPSTSWTHCLRTHSVGTDDVVVSGIDCEAATRLGNEGTTALSQVGYVCTKTGEGSEGGLNYTAWRCARGGARFTYRYYASSEG